MKHLFFLPALFYASAYAIGWIGPEPTPVVENDASLREGWTPRPTGGPKAPTDLLRRADAGPVCGYESKLAALEQGCDTNESCFYFTDYHLGACCNNKIPLTDCQLYSTCIDYESYYTSKACSKTSCNQFTGICTNSATPYCQSFFYPEISVKQFACGTASASTWRSLYITYSGQSIFDSESRFTTTLSTKSLPTTRSSFSTDFTTRSSAVPSPTPSPDEDHHTSIGAIVGGVVGGLFVIAAIIAGLVFLCLRSRKRKRNLAAAAANPTHQPQAQEQQPMIQSQPPPQQQQQQPFSPTPQGAVAAGFYTPSPPPQESKTPTYNTQTQSYYGSDVSELGSPPPPQYAQMGAGGYMQPPINRTDGAVSPVSGGAGALTPQHTGISSMENSHANTLGGDGVAQLADTGTYNQAGHNQAGHNQAGPAQQGSKPVGGNGNVYEAP